MSEEIIQSEFREIAEERALDVLVIASKTLIIGWLPVFAGGVAGWILDRVLPLLLAPLAEELARGLNFLKIDEKEQAKLYRYQEQEEKLRALLERIKNKSPDEMTDEEKKDEKDFDDSLDDVIRWD
jgi:hypothetical protein